MNFFAIIQVKRPAVRSLATRRRFPEIITFCFIFFLFPNMINWLLLYV